MKISLKSQFQFRWYHIYFLFAVLDLAIILTSLMMQHATLSSFDRLVQASNQMAIKREEVANMRSSLLRLNAPGNDVFKSRNASLERRRFEQEKALMDNLITESKNQGLNLAYFEVGIKDMSQAASNVFKLMEESEQNPDQKIQKEQEAASSMASMDQFQAVSMEHLALLDHNLSEGNKELLLEQKKILKKRQKGEWVFAVFVLMAVLGIIYFGRRIHLAFESNLEEQRKLKEEALKNKIEIEEAEARLRTILNSVVDGIVTINDRGMIELVNPSVGRIFGYSPEEMLGKNVKMLMPDPYQSKHDQYLDNYRISGEKKIIGVGREMSGQRKNGEIFPLDLSVSEVKLPNRRIFVGVLRDISTRKELEKNLFEEKEKAVQAAKAKSEFLANMSHEIRTPMNAIIGFSHILYSTELKENQQEYLKTIRSSGEHLLGIINDILDFSKLESGKVSLENIDFNIENLANDVFKMMYEKLREKKLESYIDIGPDVIRSLKGDPTRVRQIIVNLISNAIKFTDQGSIGLKISSMNHSSQDIQLRFAIIDTGIGIPKDKQGLIFEAFSQADTSTTRKYGGTGLGLSICQTLAEAMGGKIWVESEVGKGSQFIFTANFKKGTNVIESEISPLAAKELKGKTVIIVDDYKISRVILRRYCEELDLVVLGESDSVRGGLQVLDQFAQQKRIPDILLSDIMMPEADGYELARKVRENNIFKTMKIVAVTSDVRLGASHDAQSKGFDGFLPKPIIKDELIKILLTIFGDHRKEKEIVTRHLAEEVVYKDISILVVEDNVPNQKLLQALFGQLGCKAEYANNGQEAIDFLKKNSNKYHVCLMDMQMPVMGGIEATEIIRRDISRDLPIIALTAAVMEEDKLKANQAGMNDFLTKPVNFQKLKEILFKYGKR